MIYAVSLYNAIRVMQEIAPSFQTNLDFTSRLELKQPSTLRTILATCAALALLAGVVLVSFVLLRIIAAPKVSPEAQCVSGDCVKPEPLLGGSLNKNLDPCEDFGAFVCSSWNSPTIYSTDVQHDNWHRWILGIIDRLQGEDSVTWSSVAKAAAMFNACRTMGAAEVTVARAALNRFFEERGLLSAEAPLREVHPLDVLLDLAINWHLPLWFNVKILQTTNAHPIGIHLSSQFFTPYGEEAMNGVPSESWNSRRTINQTVIRERSQSLHQSSRSVHARRKN